MSLPYVSFRGVSTASLNCYVVKMPDHKKASMRNTEYAIPGRDGILHVNDGFDSITIDLKLMLSGVSAVNRQVINAWADGTGKLYTSDDTSKCYRATVLDEIVWTRDKVGSVFYDIAQITFTCEPFMYETVETVTEITSATTLLNIGNIESLPLIELHGNGNCGFTVDNEEVNITGVDPDNPVFIDSEAGYVYTADGAAVMEGDFPVLGLESTQITLTGNTSKLIITPRWGWV